MSRLSGLIDRKLAKFLLVGVVNTLVGTAIMFGLYNLAHCSYWVSSAANYILTSILSFFLNKYFTFESKGNSAGEVLRFALNIAVCYLLAYGAAQPLAQWAIPRLGWGWLVRWQGQITLICGNGLFTCLNYFGQRCFAFRER